jgi:two-component system, NtrC family, sensor kinase
MRPLLKTVAVLAAATVLAALGASNLFLKATATVQDDGVFWAQAPAGVVAARIDAHGPAAAAGVQHGDILLAVDGQPVLRPEELDAWLETRTSRDPVRYQLLRADEQRPQVEVAVRPLPQGNVTLFYYLSLVGFFSLAVGTIVMLRRGSDRGALHFYAICLLFFLTYSTSYTGQLSTLDWLLLWTDHLAILFLPVVFLHFCLTFPERRLAAHRGWLIPAAYMPAFALAGAAVAAHAFFASGPDGDMLWSIASAIDRWQPFYFGALFALSFAVLVDSYRRTRSVTTRKQMKWLVWGTGAGVMPFFFFYSIPFALGGEPRLAMELAGYIPLALIPLSLAYAVVKHRLMDVELIFRRTLVSTLVTAAIVGLCLLAVNVVELLLPDDGEPHASLIAALSALVVIVAFSPLKNRIQETIDRMLYRERFQARRSLLRLSQDLNTDLDLGRMSDRLLDGIGTALGLSAQAVLLPGPDGAFGVFRARGLGPDASAHRLAGDGAIAQRLLRQAHVLADASPEVVAENRPLDLTCYLPCRVRGELIAILGVGHKEGLNPLNSEEVELLEALAAQAATAFVNGQLYASLREKADELQELTEYSENVLESMDSGVLVLDLDNRISRWNRAMEALYGRRREDVLGRGLDEVFPPSFLEALRGSLVLGREEEFANIYKLHLPASDDRALIVNISIAPFQLGSGERRGTVLIVNDITSRLHLEDQLQHAEKMASIGLLAAGVAHEVNTPLAGISSYTQLMRQQTSADDPRAPLLEKIEKQSFRAAKIIHNLLNFARSGRGEFEELDLDKLLGDVMSLVEHQLESARIKVRRELCGTLPLVRGDENRLQQVFFNLVLNARDAMPRGGWLTLRTAVEDGAVVVEVSDTGEGIRREHIKRIYDPFFTTKGIGRGTGLGLSISYGILQEHGGAISVDSTPGQGTTFRIVLPALVVQRRAEG